MGNDPSTTRPLPTAPWGPLALSLTVVQARGLRHTSFWGMDAPYCAVQLASRKHKRSVFEAETRIDREEGGFWNETFHIRVDDPAAETVVLRIVNANAWIKEDVAVCAIPLASFVHGCIEDMWLPLYTPTHRMAASEGEVRVRIQLHGDLRSYRQAYYQSKYTYLK
ncbi:hypothetical protein SDRG_08098 [Saprolegnia diclina VS20]|uniref:C2 domain-containing protein n=1 Tax=Saprolegnia diclina (strain VS20) TaxID=1156394 RepID=T0QKK2_SAPDV|nr:hypothetical protein SDRG_08098 [Saprolegnia diclina VS20]EQC34325.1 hypothetical protein SDRG_08098 [Saprolegnia diclina VS20]|eukprot:XP_008612187.1 hypothetical protein SDRG_08098 [Saprolegnia diclina VS20]